MGLYLRALLGLWCGRFVRQGSEILELRMKHDFAISRLVASLLRTHPLPGEVPLFYCGFRVKPMRSTQRCAAFRVALGQFQKITIGILDEGNRILAAGTVGLRAEGKLHAFGF